jgi:hypothetical protein
LVIFGVVIAVLFALGVFYVIFNDKRNAPVPASNLKKIRYAIVNDNQDAKSALEKVWAQRGHNKIIVLTANEYAQFIRQDNRNYAIIIEEVPVDESN